MAQGALPLGQTSFVLRLPSATSIDRVRMEEDQSQGQRIVEYTVEAADESGGWVTFSSGITVGAKRIDVASQALSVTALRFSVNSGFGVPTGLKLFAFAPGPLPGARIIRERLAPSLHLTPSGPESAQVRALWINSSMTRWVGFRRSIPSRRNES